MSFYGSVYYQLVDTFYKVITKNASNGASFPETLETDDQEIQALGRKGILKLTNGNKWINFTYNPTENSFVVWHGKPDDGVETEVSGYKYYGDTKPNGEIINLEAGDYFSTFTSKYDEAGHLVPDTLTVQYYKMPKSEVQDDLTRLDGLVGKPAEKGKQDEQGNWITPPSESTGLFAITDNQQTQITNNANRIVFLEDIYGHDRATSGSIFFDQSTPLDFTEEDPYTLKNFPEAFGSIDAIRAGYFGSYTTDKTVSDAIIEAKRLINVVDEKATAAITNSNYQENRLDEFESNTNATMAALSTLITKNTDNITGLDTRLTTAEQKLSDATVNISNLQSADVTLAAEDTRLAGLITALSGTVDSKEAALSGRINECATKESLNTQVDILNKADAGLDSRIAALEETTSSKEEVNNLSIALSEVDTGLQKSIDSLGAADEAINSDIAKLRTDIGTNATNITNLQGRIEELNGAHTTINGNISNLQSQINEKANQSEVTSLSSTVNAKAEQSEVNALSNALNNKAEKSEIPSIAGLATQESVNNLLELITALQGTVNSLTERVAALENPAPDTPDPTPDSGSEGEGEEESEGETTE